MAVNDDNNKPAAGNTAQPTGAMGAAMGAAFTSTAASSAGQQSRPQANTFSFRNTNSIVRPAMGRNPASEALSKTAKVLGAMYEEQIDKSFEVTLIPVDMNSTTSLNVSILILAMRLREDPAVGVAFHTLILEASTEVPAPRYENINGVNTEILRVIGDSYDDNMRAVILDTVKRQFPQTTNLLNAEASVIPRDFNLTDTDAVYKLATNAAFATSSELEMNRRGFQDMNLTHAERDSTLTVRTSYNNPETVDAVNHPVRSDVVIDFQAAPANAQNNQQQNERTTPVAKNMGFVDLVYDPVAPQQQGFAPGFGQPVAAVPSTKYVARFVLTQMESMNALTIPSQLLALVAALNLREGNQWSQAFRPSHNLSGLDMHDIGAIGIEMNFEGNTSGVGTRIDTRVDSFKPENFHRMLSLSVRPGMILSLDVPECGPSTWYNGVFAAAAEGNPNANQAIIQAANTLTNGVFAKHFAGNGHVAVDENNRIHTGYYVDGSGVRKDLREIDYLAICNMVGDKDPNLIRQWSDTFFPTTPLAQRLAIRKRIITGLFSEVVITGYARRVTFEANFLDALAKSIAEIGLQVRTFNPTTDAGMFERATGNFIQGALMSGDQVGIFNRGGFSSAPSMGGNRSFGGSRW